MRHSRAERIPPAMLATTAIALALAGAGPNVDNPWFPLPVGRHWTYREGNVWYLGEATTEFEHGKPASTEGSFEDGVDGAQRGLAMPAHPKVGMRYPQEFYKGHAEDRAKIVSLNERVKVPLKRYRHTLMTLETSPIEPDVLEAKFYARGVGQVLAVDLSGGTDRELLVRFRR